MTSKMTNPAMLTRVSKLDPDFLVTLAVVFLGLALSAVMLPLFDAEAVTALGMLG
jgi:hypothetical protein